MIEKHPVVIKHEKISKIQVGKSNACIILAIGVKDDGFFSSKNLGKKYTGKLRSKFSLNKSVYEKCAGINATFLE